MQWKGKKEKHKGKNLISAFIYHLHKYKKTCSHGLKTLDETMPKKQQEAFMNQGYMFDCRTQN